MYALWWNEHSYTYAYLLPLPLPLSLQLLMMMMVLHKQTDIQCVYVCMYVWDAYACMSCMYVMYGWMRDDGWGYLLDLVIHLWSLQLSREQRAESREQRAERSSMASLLLSSSSSSSSYNIGNDNTLISWSLFLLIDCGGIFSFVLGPGASCFLCVPKHHYLHFSMGPNVFQHYLISHSYTSY